MYSKKIINVEEKAILKGFEFIFLIFSDFIISEESNIISTFLDEFTTCENSVIE